MKAIIVFCMFLIAMPVLAGTWRDDFENEQDYINDLQNGIWIEEFNNREIETIKWENGAIKVDMTPNGGGLSTGDSTGKDYTVECKVKQLKSNYDGSGILLRHTVNNLPAYFFGIKDRQPKEAGIYLNFLSPLNTFPFDYELDKWYSLKATIKGNQLEFYIDGKLMAKAEHDDHLAGWVGFGSFGTAIFDDFVTTGPDVKDGGHWNSKAHTPLTAIKTQNKLVATWGKIKDKR
jgi:hypothetical protein